MASTTHCLISLRRKSNMSTTTPTLLHRSSEEEPATTVTQHDSPEPAVTANHPTVNDGSWLRSRRSTLFHDHPVLGAARYRPFAALWSMRMSTSPASRWCVCTVHAACTDARPWPMETPLPSSSARRYVPWARLRSHTWCPSWNCSIASLRRAAEAAAAGLLMSCLSGRRAAEAEAEAARRLVSCALRREERSLLRLGALSVSAKAAAI
uniref:Uncharacterized protein n=1 Tax=Oryza nivara TaxID=4536 RepID=A0A0E0HLI4_ORYNI